MYFSGQGRVYISERDGSGNPIAMKWVGNVSALEVSLDTTKVEHSESYTGQRLTDLLLETKKTAALKATFEDWDPDNLARVLRGTVVTGSVVAITNEVIPVTTGQLAAASIAANGSLKVLVKGKNISETGIVLEDSTGTPKVLVKDTNFRVLSAAAGLIEIYDVTTGITGALTGPLVIDYAPGARKEIGMFTQGSTEYYMMFDGVNTAANNAPVVAEFFKVQFNPAQSIPLINAELGTFEVTGSVLIDATKSASTVTNPLGQFGKITQV
jgi:hypothetical protein